MIRTTQPERTYLRHAHWKEQIILVFAMFTILLILPLVLATVAATILLGPSAASLPIIAIKLLAWPYALVAFALFYVTMKTRHLKRQIIARRSKYK